MITKKINGLKELNDLTQIISKHIKQPQIILLTGDLGAGKTTFSKHLGKHLGITQNINSPTFTILKIYKTNSITLNHIDAYRIDNPDSALDLEDHIFSNSITMIEWPEKIKELLPTNTLNIDIKYINETEREFIFNLTEGELYNELNN